MDLVLGIAVDLSARQRSLLALGNVLRSRQAFLSFLAIQGSPDGDADKSFLFMLAKQSCCLALPLSQTQNAPFSSSVAAQRGFPWGISARGSCSPKNATTHDPPHSHCAELAGPGTGSSAFDAHANSYTSSDHSTSPGTALALLKYRLAIVHFLTGILEYHGSLAVAPLLGVPLKTLEVPGGGGEEDLTRGGSGAGAGAGGAACGTRSERRLRSETADNVPGAAKQRRVFLHPDVCFDTHEHDPSHLDFECINRLASLWVHLIRSLDLAPPQLAPDSEDHAASLIAIELTKLLNGFARRMKFGQWPTLINNLLDTINATLARWGPVGGHGYYHPSLACIEHHLDCLDYLAYGTAENTHTLKS